MLGTLMMSWSIHNIKEIAQYALIGCNFQTEKMRKAISISMASKRAAGYKKQLKPKAQPTIFHREKYKCPQTESENVRNVKGEEYQMLSCQAENHPSLKVNQLLD